jgi:hypothetical protein
MKKGLLALILTAVCGVSFAQSEVILNINHMFGDNPYAYNTPVAVEAGYEMKVTRPEYYMSNFVITHDGGQQLDLTDTHILVDANDSEPMSLGSHDVNTIEGISFSVGVLEEFNHLDVAQYEVGEPLGPQLPSMHWGWASGYRFLAFEGKSGANLTTSFEIHALGDENLMNQTHVLNVEAVSGIAGIFLDADYLELVYELNVSQGVIQHGSTEEAVDALLNMRSRVFSVSAPLNVETIEATSFTLYPNPANTQFVVSADQTLIGADLKVFNLNGQLVLNDTNLQQIHSVDVSTLPAGMYFVQVQLNETVLSKMLSVQ